MSILPLFLRPKAVLKLSLFISGDFALPCLWSGGHDKAFGYESKAMLLMGLFILLKYTVSCSQRLVLSNWGYLTLTFFPCQEVFLFFWFLFLIIFLNFLFLFGERHQGTGLDQESVQRLFPFLLGCRLKSINYTLQVQYSLWIKKRRKISAFS